MRPVNLIPPEDRRGDQAPLRTGPLSYILLGGLVLLLVGVVSLVLVGNQVSEGEDEVAKLKREDAVATAKAAKLASYTQFRSLSEARVATVQSLADSRFDWERVLRELALILPGNVSLTELNATASASSGEGGGEGGSGGASSLRGAVPGPALELSGCAAGQMGVAGFITALKDIDGVTRVGVQSSSVASEGGESGGGESAGECGAGAGSASFSLVVAFDAAPIPVSGEEAAVAVPEAAPEAAQAASSETSESATESPEGG